MTETAANGDATDAKPAENIVVKDANAAAIIGKTEETTDGAIGGGQTMPMTDGNAARSGTKTAKTVTTAITKTATTATAEAPETVITEIETLTTTDGQCGVKYSSAFRLIFNDVSKFV